MPCLVRSLKKQTLAFDFLCRIKSLRPLVKKGLSFYRHVTSPALVPFSASKAVRAIGPIPASAKDVHAHFPRRTTLKLIVLWMQVKEIETSWKVQNANPPSQSLGPLWYWELLILSLSLWEKGTLNFRESPVVNIWQFCLPSTWIPQDMLEAGLAFHLKAEAGQGGASLSNLSDWHVEWMQLSWPLNLKWVLQRNMGYWKLNSGSTSNIKNYLMLGILGASAMTSRPFCGMTFALFLALGLPWHLYIAQHYFSMQPFHPFFKESNLLPINSFSA